jgi:hypothetical protein
VKVSAVGLLPQNTKVQSAGIGSDTRFLRRDFTRVVIQEIPTGRYWGSRGVWTSEIETANNFQTATAALEHGRRLGLSNVQVVVVHEFKESQVIPLKTSIRS